MKSKKNILFELTRINCVVKFCITLILFLSSCVSSQIKQSEIKQGVGEIIFDKSIDDTKFKVCDEKQILEYYNFAKGFQYNNEKFTLIKIFKDELQLKNSFVESGYITIRFIVNCKGKTGRFRIQEMDLDYKPKKFKSNLSKSILKITEKLNGWEIGKFENTAFDYYQYLTFKIVNGKLIEIKP